MSASEEDKRAKQAGDEYWVSSTVVALIVSPILILGGTGTGALIGLIKGYETIYRFE